MQCHLGADDNNHLVYEPFDPRHFISEPFDDVQFNSVPSDDGHVAFGPFEYGPFHTGRCDPTDDIVWMNIGYKKTTIPVVTFEYCDFEQT